MGEKASTDVWVTVAVHVGGRTETFNAEGKSSTDGWRVAEGLLGGLHNDADEWLREQRRASRPL